MRKIFFLLAFLFFPSFTLLLKIDLPKAFAASECTYTFEPSELKEGADGFYRPSKLTVTGSGDELLDDYTYFALLFDADGSGACAETGTSQGSTWRERGCQTNRQVKYKNGKLIFEGGNLDELSKIKAEDYTITLCDTYESDSGNNCKEACSSKNIKIKQASGGDPDPDPTPLPGEDRKAGETCQLKESQRNECQADQSKQFQGNCLSSLYCDTTRESGAACFSGICQSPEDDLDDKENDPSWECSDNKDCFSGQCDLTNHTCIGGRTALACIEKPPGTGKFVCQTAVGNISTDPNSFGKSILALLMALAGGILLVLIIINGYKMMISQGDPEKIKDAREGIIAAITGILLIIFSLAILRLITADILGIPGFG